jgi:hypothetical protein
VGHDGSEVGISNLGMILSMAGLLVVLLIVAIGVAVTLPSNSTNPTNSTNSTNPTNSKTGTTTTTSTSAASAAGTGGAAEVAACRSDVMTVATALAAYQATSGSYPTPPAAWSAATYPTNFSPLTNAPAPGPYLMMPPGDNHYVILWDSAGHVWVESPGRFTPAYDAANDASNDASITAVCTRVAR